jgi:hypothetical protein
MSITIRFFLEVGEIEKAASIANHALEYQRIPYTLGLAAQVEIALARRATAAGMSDTAMRHWDRALLLSEEGLEKDPTDRTLLLLREQAAAESGILLPNG